jgi:hypothetical protein
VTEPQALRWLEPVARPRDAWAKLRLFGLPALVAAAFLWLALPWLAGLPLLRGDEPLDFALDGAIALGVFELAFFATLALDRRRITLDSSGVTLRGGAGLLRGSTIRLAALASVRPESGWGVHTTLRLVPRVAGSLPNGHTAIGLRPSDRDVTAVLDRFASLGVAVDERAADAQTARRRRNVGRQHVLYQVLITIVLVLRVANDFMQQHNDAATSSGPLSPSLDCVALGPNGILTIDAANVKDLVDVEIGDRTVNAKNIEVANVGGSRERLRLPSGSLPSPDPGIAIPSAGIRLTPDPGLEELLVTVHARESDGIRSDWTDFNPQIHHPQGRNCP